MKYGPTICYNIQNTPTQTGLHYFIISKTHQLSLITFQLQRRRTRIFLNTLFYHFQNTPIANANADAKADTKN